MKLLTTFYKIEHIKELLTYADGVVLGIKGFSSRETSYLTIEELKEVIAITTSLHKDVYLSFKPFIQSQKDALLTFAELIKDLPIKGIIVGDIGYYSLFKEYPFNIIYNPETLLTNIHDINLLKTYGIKGAFISKEITLADIKEITKSRNLDLYMVAHGYFNMFYSRRPLLKSYFETINVNHDYNHDQMRIKEEKRDGLHPIIEDNYGTHVFRSEVTSYINHIEELDLDYILVDGIFHNDAYILDILKLFKNPSKKQIKELQEKYNEVWDDGFLFKETIYK